MYIIFFYTKFTWYIHYLYQINHPFSLDLRGESKVGWLPRLLRHASELHLKDWRHTLRRFGEAAVSKFQEAGRLLPRFVSWGRTGWGWLVGWQVRISSINLEISSCFKDEINGGLCGKRMSSSKKSCVVFFWALFVGNRWGPLDIQSYQPGKYQTEWPSTARFGPPYHRYEKNEHLVMQLCMIDLRKNIKLHFA